MSVEVKFIDANVTQVDFVYDSLFHLAEETDIAERFKKSKAEIARFIFENKQAECIVGICNDILVSMAIFSKTERHFDLFEKPGMYVHAMYIVPDFRKQGIAKQLCLFLKSVAKMREWGTH